MDSPISIIIKSKGKKVYMVPKETSVSEAANQMFENRIGAILVGSGDNIEGIFTERDALFRVLVKGLDSKETSIAEVMSPMPNTVPSETTIAEAMQIVTERHIRHLPVVDDGKLAGMISSGDLTGWVAKAQESEIRGLKTDVESFAAKNKALIALIVGFAVLVMIGVSIN